MRGKLTKYDYVVGIDPDVDKSGCAFLDVEKKEFISAKGQTLTELMLFFQKLLYLQQTENKKILVVVEAGWKNESNWHLTAAARYARNPLARAAAIGGDAKRNQQRGRDILEIANGFFGFDISDPKPLKKCWAGKDGKITHQELAAFTNLQGRNNQDVRDAALLAWVSANLPIRILRK